MASLTDQIVLAVAADRFIVSNHADERLRERMIELWQILASLDSATLIDERPKDIPNPSVVVEQLLSDGTPVRVVWSWVESSRVAVLVTVHFIDG